MAVLAGAVQGALYFTPPHYSIAGFPPNSFSYFKHIYESLAKINASLCVFLPAMLQTFKMDTPNQGRSCEQQWVPNLKLSGQRKHLIKSKENAISCE